MNKLKKILSLLLSLAIAFSLTAVPAFAAEGSISGDCKLLLPSEGTIKVDYQLKDAEGNAVTEGVTYSITGEDANLRNYAYIDSATGELYIDTQAAGKTFTVTATSASVTGSLVVTAAAGYNTDFEGETVGNAVTNSMFSSKGTATVITEGEMVSTSATPDENKTNKIALATYFGPKYALQHLTITPEDLNSQKLTIEAKLGIWDTDEHTGFPHMYPLAVMYKTSEGTDVDNYPRIYFENVKDESAINLINLKATCINSAGSQVSTKNVASIGSCYTLLPTKVVLENNNTISLYINDTVLVSKHQYSTVVKPEHLIKEIRFGSYVDDIEIYSGEKVSGGYEIVGDSYICRAPEGTSANIKYTAEPVLPWTEEDPSLYLALKAAHGGVSVSGMTVTVAGNATAGDFVLQLKNADGTVVGEKTVTVVGDIDMYTVLGKERYFEDFEHYTAGDQPSNTTNGQSKRYDYALGFSNRTSANITTSSVIKADGDNLYLSAQGRSNYSNAAGANAYFSLLEDIPAYRMSGVTCGTFEADFMAESEVISAGTAEYSLFSEISADGTSGLDIRYDDLGDGSIVIYSYTGDDGHGKLDYTLRKTLAVVPADTWFNFRIEADFVNKTYDLYINNRKVVNDAKHDMDVIGTVYFGAAIDNVSVYHGSKVAAEDTSGTELRVSGVKQNGFAYNTNISVSGTGNKAVAVQLSDSVTGLDSDSKVIIAQYNKDNQMKSCTVGAIKLDGGVALACSVLDTEVEQDDYFKAFLWNFGQLIPLK